ncbi:hypothetical protein ACHAXH_009495 [Discostella pseudostelligera]|jgi:hypothetical protein
MFIRNLLSIAVAIAIAILSVNATAETVRGSTETTGDVTSDADADLDILISYWSTCYADSDCSAVVRSRAPSKIKEGVKLCACYADSSSTPFDECEGESDATCMAARCANSCEGKVAYCYASNCALRRADESRIW